MFQWDEIEKSAREAELQFFLHQRDAPVWSYYDDSPHLSAFAYSAQRYGGPDDSLTEVAKVSGYRIVHDWRLSEEEAWRGADSVDTDFVCYVDALIREMGCCQRAGLGDPAISHTTHITLLSHVAPCSDRDAGQTWLGVTASLLLKDAPDFLVVDPRAFDRTGSAEERLTTRARIAQLKQLGLVRMVCAPLLWGWNVELAESFMEEYDYEALLRARRSGELEGVVDERVAHRVYGPLSPEQLAQFRLPIPEEPVD